ncbi:putative aspartyl protease [Ophiocordyceps camponoti-leonardi (nom. inval.)]|nr:putative aspartyl protease [Ophiocordyceps camponoti-leonardi (nom. inval.)]
MHSSLYLALTLCFATISALAAPSPSKSGGIQKRSFIVKRVPTSRLQARDGVEEMAKAFNKFSIPVPRDLKNAVEKRQLKKRELAMAAESRGLRRDVMGGDQDVRLGLAASMDQRRSLRTSKVSPQRRDTMGGDQDVRLGLAVSMGQRRSLHPRQDQDPAAAEQPTATEQPAAAAETAASNQTQGGQQQQAQAEEGKQSGSVEATPENNDAEYLAPVKIGGQELVLDFDTGSSDLWVFNTQLKDQQQQGPGLQTGGGQQQAAEQGQLQKAIESHTLYNPQQSQTFRDVPGLQFKISYGDGSGAQGTVGMDVVEVGGVKAEQAVQLATSVTGSFLQDSNNNGLMGLAFSKINTVKPDKQKTFFESVMPSLQEPVFTADLRRNASGAYEFGKIDSSKFQGDMVFTPVNNSQGFWQFTSDKFAVGDGQPQQSTAGAQAIADTGTTLILADSNIVKGYYSQVEGAQVDKSVGGFTVPCDAKLPDLMLAVGDNMARVGGDQMNFAPIEEGSTSCFGGMQAVPPGTMGIYGDIFFKSNFVAFKGGSGSEGPSLGFAQHS